MRRVASLIALAALAGCAPHYVWVEDEPAAKAEPAPPGETSDADDELKGRNQPFCEGSTRAARMQHRTSRYSSIDGFTTRNCVPRPKDP